MLVTRNNCELSRKYKQIGLKYYCPQIHHIRTFSICLFHFNEIKNDGIYCSSSVRNIKQ